MNKILTIVIPTYNMEALLPKCLTSLVCSDYHVRAVIEAIVVIDGATDRSSAIAHEYEKNYPELFRVIDKENGNYGSCVNRGLNEAKGKYIKVLDADDSFNTEALEQFVTILANTDADMIVTSGVNVTPQDEENYQWDFSYQSGTIYPIEQLHHVWIHDVTHKTSILRAINYEQTERISYSDEEWVFFPMFQIKDFLALDLRLYRYTVGRDGQTMNLKNWRKTVSHEMIVSRKMFDYLTNTNWTTGRASSYIQEKMRDRMGGFYNRALIACHLYNNEEIKDFDLYLKNTCPDIWQQLDTLKANSSHFPFFFVRYWRKHNYSLNRVFNVFRLYQIWARLRSLK